LKQIKSLLLLRSNQCYRYLNEIGFGIIIVAIFILTGVLFNALQRILTTPNTGAILLSIVLLLAIEVKRQDTVFLKSIFETKQALIRYKFIENVLIVVPILIFQSIFLQSDIIIYIISICGFFAYIPFHLLKSQAKERKRSLDFIPLSLFEIKFHFEKKIWSMTIVWVLILLGGFHISLWVLGMFALCMVPIEIFTPIESREMLNYKPLFVLKKIKDSVLFFLLFAILPTIVTYIFIQTNILVLMYGIIAMLLSIILSISKKYATYYGVTEFASSSTSTMILIFLMLPPGGILITFSACIYYYFKAEKHMKNNYASL